MSTVQITYFSILPNDILLEILMELVNITPTFREVFKFVRSIPKINVLIENKNRVAYLIKMYLPKKLVDILLSYNFGINLRGPEYFMAFCTLYRYINYTIVTLESYLSLDDESKYIYENEVVTVADEHLISDLSNVSSLYHIFLFHKHFYNMITFDISHLGTNFDFLTVLHSLYDMDKYIVFDDDKVLSYIRTGQIEENYIIIKIFNYLGEIYDKSPYYLFIIVVILLSDKINLDLQDNEGLFTLILFIVDNELFFFLFEKLRAKLSHGKKIDIVKRYRQNLRLGRYHGEGEERLIYNNEICNLLLEN